MGNLKEIKKFIEFNNNKKEEKEEEKYKIPSISLQDESGWTALHYAASSSNPKAVEYLLKKGAIWAITDNLGHTAGDVAFSMNDIEIYQIINNEGFKSELLRITIEENNKETEEENNQEIEQVKKEENTSSNNVAFLSSKLKIFKTLSGQTVCVNSDGHGVMLGWEKNIMKQTAKLLCHSKFNQLRILNVGFGIGLIDNFFQSFHPKQHVIIEPHIDILNYMKKEGWNYKKGVHIYPGTWQSFLKFIENKKNQNNIENNEIDIDEFKFDVIFWDTFSEDYQSLKNFFNNVFDLLSGPNAKFSWFHGLGATSRTLYDIYTEITEMDLREAGLKVCWSEVQVDRDEVSWDGIKRRYWNVPSPYRLPICTFDI